MTKKITILIPVHNNRHLYLSRLLNYYSNSGFRILVFDSSSIKYTNPLINKEVMYHHTPALDLTEKIHLGLQKIDTPYVVICAVDDFIIPAAIENCVSFLDNNPDYNCAQGNVIHFFSLYKNQIVSYPSNPLSIGMDLNTEFPTQRLHSFFISKPAIFYSVQRTESLREIYNLQAGKITNYFLCEFFSDIISLIQGKYKTLPVFYSAREANAHSSGNLTNGMRDIVNLKGNCEEFQLFLETTSDYLNSKEGIVKSQALIFIKKLIHDYCSYQINLDKENIDFFDSPSAFSYLKKKMERIPVLGKYLGRIYNENIGIKRLQNHYHKSVKNKDGFPYNDSGKKEWDLIKKFILKYPVI